MTKPRMISDDASDWGEISARLSKLERAVLIPPLWEDVTYGSGWTTYAGLGVYTVQAAALPAGMITMRGLAVRTGSAFSFGDQVTNLICTLPEGMYPKRTQFRGSWLYDINNSSTPARIVISSDGAVRADLSLGAPSGGSTSGAAGGYITLDGMAFPTF